MAITREQEPMLLDCLLDMAALLLDAGAEISRVEDTISRLGRAYGAQRVEVFVITSIISLTMEFPGREAITETRRVRSDSSTDFYRVEKLNALSRRCCAAPLPPEELREQVAAVAAGHKPFRSVLIGSILGSGAFTIFFGGTIWDALAAIVFGVLICLLQRYLGRTRINTVASNLLISMLIGLGVGALTLLLPMLHMDMILIGDIMLLIPGMAMTNAVRNLLVGDTISGVVRLAESLVWAGALAGGFMAAMLLLDTLR